jgi:hypothetical protein
MEPRLAGCAIVSINSTLRIEPGADPSCFLQKGLNEVPKYG